MEYSIILRLFVILLSICDAVNELEKHIVPAVKVCNVVFDLRNPSLTKLKSLFLSDIDECTLSRIIPCDNNPKNSKLKHIKPSWNETSMGAIVLVAADPKHASFYFTGSFELHI